MRHRLSGSGCLLSVRLFACLFAAASLSSISFPAHAEVSVTNSGTPAYRHPIAVPPGVKGMAPQLALAYTGSRRNGQVGVSWSLSGISAITRCSATRATDGHHVSPMFNADDKLCLDGERLIPTDTNGANPQVGASVVLGAGKNDAAGLPAGSDREYRTEKDSYARIRAYGYADGSNAASGPLYFRVWTKDGKILDFGNGPAADANTQATITASYAPSQTNHYAQLWAVSRIADIFGNHIDFKYTQRDVTWGSQGSITAGHEWNLAEIQYSGNKVVFRYTDRAGGSPLDGSEAYLNGGKTVVLNRLASITTYINSPNTTTLGAAAGAVAVATTNLGYDTGPHTGRSRLTSIKTCAGDVSSTRCAPAATFSYTSGGDDSYQAASNFNLANTPMFAGTVDSYPFGAKGIVTADFDGDGKTDILIWSADPTQNQLWISNGDGTFTQRTNFNINHSDEVLFTQGGCQQAIVKDFNGDGLVDILRFSTDYIGQNGRGCSQTEAQTPPEYLYLNNGNGTFTRHNITGIVPSTVATYWNPATNAAAGVPLSTVDGFDIQWDGGVIWAQGEQFYLMDIDGDGLLDVVTTLRPETDGQTYPYPGGDLCANVVCTHVYKGDGQGNFTEIPTSLAHTSLYPHQGPLPPGGANVMDADGDGLPDLAITDFNGDSTNGTVAFPEARSFPVGAYVARSRGDGNFDILPVTTANSGLDYFILTGALWPIDYNGDGKLDLVGAVRDTPVAPFFTEPGNTNMSLPSKINAGGVVVGMTSNGRQGALKYDTAFVPPTNILYVSNGDGTYTASSSFNLNGIYFRHLDSSGYGTVTTFVVGDFTGHGNPEFLITNNNGTNTLYLKANPEPPDLLATVTDEAGAQTSFTYVPLPNPTFAGNTLGPRYTSDRGTANAAMMPKIDVSPPMYLVATMQSDNGVGGTVNTEFSYFGLKADTMGRDLLGFRAVRKQVVVPTGVVHTSETTVAQDFPYIGAPANVAVYRAGLNAIASSNLLSNTANVYCDQTAAAGADSTAIASRGTCPSSSVIKRPYLLWSQATAKDLGGNLLPTVTTQTAINADGEPTTVNVTKTLTGTAADTYQTITTDGYFTDNTACSDMLTCSWILARVQSTATESKAPSSLLATSAGTAPNATALQGTGEAGIAKLQSNAAFGSHAYGTAIANQSITVKNTGGGPLTLTASAIGSPFTQVGNSCTNVSPNATCAITYAMANNQIGGFNRTITLTGSSLGTITATVSGTVTGSIATLTSGTALALGSTGVASPSPQGTWTFRNDGNAAMTLNVSALNSPFSLAGNSCANVAPGAGCSITVAMGTANAGSYGQSGIGVSGASLGARSDLSVSGAALADTMPWANGSTQSFCLGPRLSSSTTGPGATYSFAVGGGTEAVTLTPTSTTQWSATPVGWTNGASLAAGTYKVTIQALQGGTASSITIRFARTGQSSTANISVIEKAGGATSGSYCP